MKKDSFLFGANSVFIEELYSQYVKDPNSVDQSWRELFQELPDPKELVEKVSKGASWAPKSTKIIGQNDSANQPKQAKESAASPENVAASDSIRAHMLIRAYRVRGHYLADLDPLGMEEKKTHAQLSLHPGNYGFTDKDYDRPIYIGNEVVGLETATLRELVNVLEAMYCSHIGVEFMHIQDLEQKEWIQHQIESLAYEEMISNDEKKSILNDIIEVEGFEQFLHVKFPGTKRFSVEGGASSICAVDAIIKTSAELDVKEIVIGMPHRGRLNVLTKIMRKPYYSMLSEFQGNLAHPEDLDISGDVKYHLGTSSDREFPNNKTVHLSLTPNPSHLEAVNPVVAGRVRAKQDLLGDKDRRQVMGILLHGDAAFAGQGVVAETLSLGDLVGYHTGGTAHIIVNNQIGFTTSPKNARISRYPTEVAKIVQAPIFHVNGDDPEAVVKVSKIAANFRHRFKKDVIVDVICYRLHGHNEGDEPLFTQPLMYKNIAKHPTAIEIYSKKLLDEKVVNQEEVKGMETSFRSFLDKELEKSLNYKPNVADWLAGRWTGFEKSEEPTPIKTVTGVKLEILKKIGLALCKYPENFNINPKIARQMEAKRKMIELGEGIDWATAEALAFGTLMAENVPIRLTGQDARRGTFSHRHSVLIDQENEDKYVPLNNLGLPQANYEVHDSNLSEFAVLGFEYGYSLVDPKSLVLWEAQFGDFVNGAQVIIDQFISSSEIKWLRLSGLVMLLPHGYEGQGPEHSSAKLERFLQLCAEDNIQVANCTTPASYFHILRRQISRNFRKPLIIFTPKSLLRHKLAVSKLEDMAEGTKFKPVIGDETISASDDKVRKLIICSGKVYYDLFEEREKRSIKDIAIIRMEQFYPFPSSKLTEQLMKYKNAQVIWCQEEPKNMGGWSFVNPLIEEVLATIKVASKRASYVGRKEAASPAAGYKKIHDKEQADIINAALS